MKISPDVLATETKEVVAHDNLRVTANQHLNSAVMGRRHSNSKRLGIQCSVLGVVCDKSNAAQYLVLGILRFQINLPVATDRLAGVSRRFLFDSIQLCQAARSAIAFGHLKQRSPRETITK